MTHLGGDEHVISGEFPRSERCLQPTPDAHFVAIDQRSVYVTVPNVERVLHHTCGVVLVLVGLKMWKGLVASWLGSTQQGSVTYMAAFWTCTVSNELAAELSLSRVKILFLTLNQQQVFSV